MSAGGTTKEVHIWLCPDCAASRETVRRWWLWIGAVFFGGLLIHAIIGHYWQASSAVLEKIHLAYLGSLGMTFWDRPLLL
jgi:hypothetical protein